MVERVVRDDEVAGSNPVTPIRQRRIEQWSRRTGEQLSQNSEPAQLFEVFIVTFAFGRLSAL